MSAWRDAVREKLARYRKRTGESELEFNDFYDASLSRMKRRFPDNVHPKKKVRQILQQLRGRGEIEFLDGAGTYRIRSLDLAGLPATSFERIASENGISSATDNREILTE